MRSTRLDELIAFVHSLCRPGTTTRLVLSGVSDCEEEIMLACVLHELSANADMNRLEAEELRYCTHESRCHEGYADV